MWIILFLLGLIGGITGIILIIIKAVSKKGLSYLWSILITALSFVLFIGGIIAMINTQELQSAFITSYNEARGTVIDPASLPWNVQDMNVETNGNMVVAIQLLTTNLTDTPIEIPPATVFKSPWKYYGKLLKITGVVGIIQEYPPGSQITEAFGGGEVSEIVMATNDDTIIDYFHKGSTGDINTDDSIVILGYCTGLCEVENKLGGKTTQLVVVGKDLKKLVQ